MQNNPRGYVSPERWDKGVNAAFVDYGVNGYQSQSNGVTSQNIYASLNMGVNLGDWRLRQRSALNWGNESGSSHQSLSTYAQRDIDALRSQLTLGDSFTDSELFDSVATRGARLASDDRMLPDSQRGYAPVVRGIAATNARVTIRQNGYVIHESTVAPGAFEILDLNPTSDSGDLNVTVTEADGRESTFSVPFSSVARSLRPGTSRYTTTVGQARDLPYGSKPTVAQATYQRGLTNLITGYTGTSASEGYAAVLIGGVLNTEYGAFGSDITGARTELGDKTFTGQSARVTYNKLVQSTGTNFSVAAYRYSTDGYFGFSDALNGSLSKGRDYQQASAGINGSVVAHPGGVTFGQSLGDSIAIIDAPGAAGAQVSNASNVKLDGQGQAVVPYLSAYRVNRLELDPKGLSDDVELKSTSQEVVPRSGAVMLVKFDTVNGRALLIKSLQADGSPLPFGTAVFDEQNQEVGTVGQGGQIFARVNGDKGTLHITLAGQGAKQCSITYDLKPRGKGQLSTELERLNAPCL
ncbi:fimbria/pilus outer membrane usher protein [Pseudomonas sp. LB3P31]